MPVKVRCPNPACGQANTVPDDRSGKMTRCPHCQANFTVPGFTTNRTQLPNPNATADPVAPGIAPAVDGSLVSHRQPACQPTPDNPAQIGRFQIRARLGAGAFGTVYRAYDPVLDREVAVKVPRKSTLDSPERVERFQREARAAARLRHPHIVPVYDAGQDGHRHYIASAFIEGHTLADLLDQGPLDSRRAARMVRILAEALAYAHLQGIVHRDVKPANVVVDAQDQPYLMDFGLAHLQDPARRLTQLGAVLGTPAYMAPEQAAGKGEAALPASDQYSLGILLYELLSGQTPFSGPVEVVLFNQIRQSPPRPRSVNPAIPQELEAICLQALAKRPENRYPTCQAMADALGRWLETRPDPAPSPGARPQAAMPPSITRPTPVPSATSPNHDRAAEAIVSSVGGQELLRPTAPTGQQAPDQAVPTAIPSPAPGSAPPAAPRNPITRQVILIGLLAAAAVAIAIWIISANKPARERAGGGGTHPGQPLQTRSPFKGHWRGSRPPHFENINGKMENIKEDWDLKVDTGGNLSGYLNSNQFGKVEVKGQIDAFGKTDFVFTAETVGYRGSGSVFVNHGSLVGTIKFYRGNDLGSFSQTAINLPRQ